MQQDILNKNLKILAIITLIIVILYTLLQIGYYFMDLVTIFGIAIILTYVLMPFVNILDKAFEIIINKIIVIEPKNKKDLSTKILALIKKIAPVFQKRILSIFTVYILSTIIVIILALQLIPPAIYQVKDLAKNIPSYAEETINYINKNFPEIEIPGISEDIKNKFINNRILKQTVPIITHETTDDSNTISLYQDKTNSSNEIKAGQEKISGYQLSEVVKQTAAKFQADIIAFVQNNAQNAINNLINVAAGTLTGIGYTVTIIVLTFYFLLDGKKLINWLNTLIPKKFLAKTIKLEHSIHESLLGFLKGQVFLGIATGGFMLIVYILFDVEYFIFLSLFLAIAEIIPIIGSYLGFIPAIIVMVATGNILTVIPVWLIFFIYQSIKDNIVAPKIVGEIIGLHPVTVIFSLWIGYQVAGFFGILFAIPLASVINVIVNFIIEERMNLQEEINTEV